MGPVKGKVSPEIIYEIYCCTSFFGVSLVDRGKLVFRHPLKFLVSQISLLLPLFPLMLRAPHQQRWQEQHK